MNRASAALVAGGLVASAVLGGCSSSGSRTPSPSSTASSSAPASSGSSGGSGTPAPPAVRAAIAKSYAALFGTKASLAQSLASLQNGQAFRSVIVAESKQPAAKGSGAKLVSASMVNRNLAKVVFTVYSQGQPALPNAPGYAVRQNGRWKVAAKTFCGLLVLQGNAPKACNDPKITALPR